MNPCAPRRAHAARALTIAALAITAVACSDDQQLADIAPATSVAPPVTTEPAATTVPETTATTEPAADTTVEATVADTATPSSTIAPDPSVTGPMFSDALGVKVDAAPGVNTPGDTRQLLPEGLYVHIAWQADPNDPSVFTARPEDIEILEAYANVSLAYYRAALSDRTTNDPAFKRYMVDGGAQYERGFEEALSGNFVGSLGSGVILRPYVIADQTTEATAVVLDCYLQNEQYIVQGTDPEFGDLQTRGTLASLVRTPSGWKVDTIAAEPRACL